jgi:hypothetical protein
MAGEEPKITSEGGMGELLRLGWMRRDGSPLPSNECGVVIAFYICTSNANPSAPVRPVLQLSKGYCLDLNKNCVALGKSEVVKTCHSGTHLPSCRNGRFPVSDLTAP